MNSEIHDMMHRWVGNSLARKVLFDEWRFQIGQAVCNGEITKAQEIAQEAENILLFGDNYLRQFLNDMMKQSKSKICANEELQTINEVFLKKANNIFGDAEAADLSERFDDLPPASKENEEATKLSEHLKDLPTESVEKEEAARLNENFDDSLTPSVENKEATDLSEHFEDLPTASKENEEATKLSEHFEDPPTASSEIKEATKLNEHFENPSTESVGNKEEHVDKVAFPFSILDGGDTLDWNVLDTHEYTNFKPPNQSNKEQLKWQNLVVLCGEWPNMEDGNKFQIMRFDNETPDEIKDTLIEHEYLTLKTKCIVIVPNTKWAGKKSSNIASQLQSLFYVVSNSCPDIKIKIVAFHPKDAPYLKTFNYHLRLVCEKFTAHVECIKFESLLNSKMVDVVLPRQYGMSERAILQMLVNLPEYCFGVKPFK